MNWLRWRRGRQPGSYWKMLLAAGRWPIPFDCYLIRYPSGSYIKGHVDPVKSMQHFRCNVVLWPARRGGKFLLDGVVQPGRVHRFRPDLYRHAVTPITEGSRWVLSFGWVRP